MVSIVLFIFALLFGWPGLAGLLNSTTVEFARDRIRIRIGPVPYPGNLDISARELAQLYSTEEIRDARSLPPCFTLRAICRDGTKRQLLTGLTEIEQVLWLEQELERHLGIEDRPVDGEVTGRTA